MWSVSGLRHNKPINVIQADQAISLQAGHGGNLYDNSIKVWGARSTTYKLLYFPGPIVVNFGNSRRTLEYQLSETR